MRSAYLSYELAFLSHIEWSNLGESVTNIAKLTILVRLMFLDGICKLKPWLKAGDFLNVIDVVGLRTTRISSSGFLKFSTKENGKVLILYHEKVSISTQGLMLDCPNWVPHRHALVFLEYSPHCGRQTAGFSNTWPNQDNWPRPWLVYRSFPWSRYPLFSVAKWIAFLLPTPPRIEETRDSDPKYHPAALLIWPR